MTGEEPVTVLECVGMVCPQPVIELARRFPSLAVGELIGVRADDPAAASDIPAWCRLRGQSFEGAVSAEGATLYLVRRIS